MYKIEVGNQEKAAEIVETVTSDKLTVTELDGLMEDFVHSVTDGTHQDHGKMNTGFGTIWGTIKSPQKDT